MGNKPLSMSSIATEDTLPCACTGDMYRMIKILRAYDRFEASGGKPRPPKDGTDEDGVRHHGHFKVPPDVVQYYRDSRKKVADYHGVLERRLKKRGALPGVVKLLAEERSDESAGSDRSQGSRQGGSRPDKKKSANKHPGDFQSGDIGSLPMLEIERRTNELEKCIKSAGMRRCHSRASQPESQARDPAFHDDLKNEIMCGSYKTFLSRVRELQELSIAEERMLRFVLGQHAKKIQRHMRGVVQRKDVMRKYTRIYVKELSDRAVDSLDTGQCSTSLVFLSVQRIRLLETKLKGLNGFFDGGKRKEVETEIQALRDRDELRNAAESMLRDVTSRNEDKAVAAEFLQTGKVFDFTPPTR